MIGAPKILMVHVTWPCPFSNGLSSMCYVCAMYSNQPTYQIWSS